jgi:hypothetical protein
MPDSFVVKVQLSLSTDEPKQQVLIYDRDNKYYYQGDASPEIIEVMDGRDKAFFMACIKGNDMVIDQEVKGREWDEPLKERRLCIEIELGADDPRD